MKASNGPRSDFHGQRLLVVDAETRQLRDTTIEHLASCLRTGDVLVVNDAATLPASLRVSADLELRLIAHHEDDAWWAVALGPGDHRTPTERRAPPPPLRLSDRFELADLTASVRALSPQSERLVLLQFSQTGSTLWQSLYQLGRPIQYAHVPAPLALWDVQTVYAGRPVAVEMPSAGRPLTFSILHQLQNRGIETISLTHAAGVSSTGVPAIDEHLPLPERYWLSPRSVHAINGALQDGRRLIAAGTSVVRALEDNYQRHGELVAGTYKAHGHIGPGSELRVVSGLLTGMHEPDTPHFELMQAFVSSSLLAASMSHAAARCYLSHEFGDSALLLPGALA